MSGRNVIVSIGRNVGDEPMSNERWIDFKLSVCSLFPQRIFTGTGIGEYEGTKEESFSVIAPAPTEVWFLRGVLRALAREYGQECIALSIAEPEMIGPDEPKVEEWDGWLGPYSGID